MDLGLEFQKTNVGIKISILDLCFLEFQKTNVEKRINILETPCVPIFRQTDNFDFFSPNLPKSEIKFGNSEN